MLKEPGVIVEIRIHLFLMNCAFRLQDIFAFVFRQVGGVSLKQRNQHVKLELVS